MPLNAALREICTRHCRVQPLICRPFLLLVLLASLTGCNSPTPPSSSAEQANSAAAVAIVEDIPDEQSRYTPAPGIVSESDATEIDWLDLMSEEDLQIIESGDFGELPHDTQEQSFPPI